MERWRHTYTHRERGGKDRQRQAHREGYTHRERHKNIERELTLSQHNRRIYCQTSGPISESKWPVPGTIG